MRAIRYVLLMGAAAALLAVAPVAQAQLSIGVNLGAAPACPYGYYDYAPYNCSPYGYYGPQWFNGGVFIGAGPWYHGGHGFYGPVNNHYDPHHGYRGPFPQRSNRSFSNFHGNEMRDGQGHSQAFHGGDDHYGGGGDHH